MLEESEVRAIVAKGIDQSKSSARVDTGAFVGLWRTLTFVALLPLGSLFTVNLVITQS
jgi:hypothetical protein